MIRSPYNIQFYLIRLELFLFEDNISLLVVGLLRTSVADQIEGRPIAQCFLKWVPEPAYIIMYQPAPHRYIWK